MSGQAERPAAATKKLLYSVEEAADMLGIGRTYMFHLLATGEISSLKIGRCRKIPSDALESYVRRIQAEQCSCVQHSQDTSPASQRDEPQDRQ